MLCVSGANRVNWDAIGAIAEAVGAIGVLATLVYLAVQVRHSRTLMEQNYKLGLSQMYQARASEGMENQRLYIASDYIAGIAAKLNGGASFEELSDEEKRRVQALGQLRALHTDNLFYQYELGLLNEEQMVVYRDNLKSFYPTWIESGIQIPPRLQKICDEMGLDSGDA